MDDRPLIVANYALDLGLAVDYEICEKIAEAIGDADIDFDSVRAAAEQIGITTPAAAA